MNKVIRSYSKFADDQQSKIYSFYFDGRLERTKLPYRGTLTDGIIYSEEDTTYLIPICTIQAVKATSEKEEEKDDIEEEELIELEPDTAEIEDEEQV